jgi:hypothetical protein
MDIHKPSAVISARWPHLQLHQFVNVQFPVVINIQPVEFCLHKAHELLLGDFAILVCIHQEQQLLGRWHSGCDLLIVISGGHRSGNCSGYEHCPDCPCDYPSIKHDAPPPRLSNRTLYTCNQGSATRGEYNTPNPVSKERVFCPSIDSEQALKMLAGLIEPKGNVSDKKNV